MNDQMDIIIGGASGLIGTALIEHFTEQGRRVSKLVRRTPDPGTDEIYWQPETGEIDAAKLERCQAVIHLGGVNIAGRRWTASYKKQLRQSRLTSTKLLAETLAQLRHPPHTFITASATGYFGNRDDEILTEDSPPGDGFLPELCRQWEAATDPARQAGIRTVNLRLGIVLSGHGGALEKMIRIFKMGGGAILGSGRQYMSWITLTDVVRVVAFILANREITGPVNTITPHPVTNREFTRTLGRLLGKFIFFRAPAFAVRILMGEMGHTLLLGGHRVHPAKLQNAGFKFLYETLEPALRHELQQSPPHEIRS